MSGWLDKRGGLEATKVRIINVSPSLFSFLCAEVEKTMVHTKQSPTTLL